MNIKRWYKWVSAWYIVYALLGIVSLGLVPILLPLAVSSKGAGNVGIIMAGFYLGGISASVAGYLCDKYRLHKTVIIGGLLLLGISLGIFRFSHSLIWMLLLSILMGTGISGVSTVANLLIVEKYPETEWDDRIGWLQSFFGIGQVMGLVLVILFTKDILAGFFVSSMFVIMGIMVSFFTIRTPDKPISSIKQAKIKEIKHGEWSVSGPNKAHHRINIRVLKSMKNIFRTEFGIFMIAWLLVYTGAAGVFSLYPVLYKNYYHVPPGLSSAAFAIAVAAGLFLYAPSGMLSNRMGAKKVLGFSIGIRIIAFLFMAILPFIPSLNPGIPSLLLFGIIVLAWSPLSVSSLAYTASISTIGEGEAMGIYNTVSNLAGVIGSLAGGLLASFFGYGAVPLLAAVLLSVGLLVLSAAKKAAIVK